MSEFMQDGMGPEARVYTVADLTDRTAEVIGEIREADTPALVTDHGRFAAVITPLQIGQVESRVLRQMALEFTEARDKTESTAILEDVMRKHRVRESIAEGEQAMASGEPMVTLDSIPGAYERTMENLESARAGDTVPLDEMSAFGRRLSVNVALDVAATIEEIAARHQITITDVIRRAVSAYKWIDDEQSAGGKIAVRHGDCIRAVSFDW